MGEAPPILELPASSTLEHQAEARSAGENIAQVVVRELGGFVVQVASADAVFAVAEEWR